MGSFIYTVYIQGKLLRLNYSREPFLYSPKSKSSYCCLVVQQHQLWETWFHLTHIKGRFFLNASGWQRRVASECSSDPSPPGSNSQRHRQRQPWPSECLSVAQEVGRRRSGQVKQPNPPPHSFFHFHVFTDDRSWETSLWWPPRTTKGETNGTRCTLDPQVDLRHVLQSSTCTPGPTCSVQRLTGDARMQKECKLPASEVASFDSGCRNGKIIFLYLLESVAICLKYGLVIGACLSVPIRTHSSLFRSMGFTWNCNQKCPFVSFILRRRLIKKKEEIP